MAASKPKKIKKRASGNEAAIEEAFDSMIRQVRKAAPNPNAIFTLCHLEGAPLKRRKKAASNYLKIVEDRYGKMYPDMDIAEVWGSLCSDTAFSAGQIEVYKYYSLAAAIFMLDEINRRHLLYDAYKVFPKAEDALSNVALPDFFFDPCNETSVVKGILYVLRNHFGAGNWKDYFFNEISAAVQSEHIVPEGAPVEELDSRSRFSVLFSMIHPVLKERAVKRFEEKMWEFLDIYFQRSNDLLQQQTAFQAKSDNILRECEQLSAEIAAREKLPVPSSKIPFAAMPLELKFPLMEEANINRGIADRTKIEQLSRQGLALLDRADLYERKRTRLPLMAVYATGAEIKDPANEQYEEAADKEFFSKIQNLSVDDPYEICFGFICLLEYGSDIPWLYNPALAVLSIAANQLPWAVPSLDDEAEEEADTDESLLAEDSFRTGNSDYSNSEVNKLDIPECVPEDVNDLKALLYARKYSDAPFFYPIEVQDTGKKINLAQMVYGMSYTLMPRSADSFDGIQNYLEQAGMATADARIMELYLTMAESIRQPSENMKYLVGQRILDDLEEPAIEVEEETDINDTDVKDLHEQCSSLKKANKDLRQSLYETARELRLLKETLFEEKAAHELDRQELSDLREIVFLAKNKSEPELQKVPDIAFPYETEHRIIVFGGHESWLKAIRPMLPGVVFVNREAKPNEDLIRHADVVFIQPNALSHHAFYSIINIVRSRKIPLHYFSFASAEKCAQQLVLADRYTQA